MAAPFKSMLWKRLYNHCQLRLVQLNTLRYKEQGISKIKAVNEFKEDGEPTNKKQGSVRKQVVKIPQTLLKAASVVIDNYPVTDLVGHAEELKMLLKARKRKLTQKEFDMIVDRTMKEFKSQGKNDAMNEEGLKIRANKKAISSCKWFPMRYSGQQVLQYLAARLCGDYSSIYSCLREIYLRDKSFEPRSVLDFGSGLGTSVWATSAIWKRVEEYYCINSSDDMNTVARLLLQDGKEDGYMKIPVHFREDLPYESEFDLVISTYTLMEMESENKREKLLETLWNMTKKYLIIVEKGSHSGFSLLNETRQHLLKLSEESKEGHIYSPCPHHKPCPKLKDKNSPCFFQARYNDLEEMQSEHLEEELYSYIIFKVGPKLETEEFLPRIVDEPYKTKTCTHCHLCCLDGKLRHEIINAPLYGQALYKNSRGLIWGDMLPATVTEESSNSNINEQNNEVKSDNS